MKKLIYLDNAASTRLSSKAAKAMKPFFDTQFGNPSSLHEAGRSSKQAIEQSRSDAAKVLNSQPREIIFTAGGTESINLAIFGIAKVYQSTHHKPGHIITSTIEHEAVLECVKALQQWGWQVDYVNVDKNGLVKTDELKKKIKKNTVLISVMYANNEVGTIQPIAEIGRTISGINRTRNKQNLPPIYFHTDACQAGGVLSLDVAKLKVDLMTVNGSKIHGPKGSGILYLRTGINIEPIIYGGGQERGLRSGTENTPAIVGFAAALTESQIIKSKETKQLLALQQTLESSLQKIKGITINGPSNFAQTAGSKHAPSSHRANFTQKSDNFDLTKLPGTTNFSIKGIEGEAFMYYLNGKGFAVATGSACTTGSEDPSHVLLAMGLTPEAAKSSVRISLSTDIKKSDIAKFITALKESIKIIEHTVQEID
ncbi:cysteine desulfurase [bacterium]|nr:MAG: cysteine desulfurase [bacterium]